MLLKEQVQDIYNRGFEKFTGTFIQVFSSENPLDDLCQPEEEKLKLIAERMSGSQSALLDALHFSVSNEPGLAELEFELYSKQPEAHAVPAFYLSFQQSYETRTLMLGEYFFAPLADVSLDIFSSNVEAVTQVISMLARFKAASEIGIDLDELDTLLEKVLSQNVKEKDEDPMNLYDETVLHTGNADEKVRERAFDPDAEETTEDIFEWEEDMENEEQEEQEELETVSDDEEDDSNVHVYDFTDVDLDDLDWNVDFDEIEAEDFEEEEEPLALLNEAIIELYKRSDSNIRPLVKELRGELFELEVAYEIEAEFQKKVLQFQRQLLSLNLHDAEDLQIQVQMARHSLALLTASQEG